MGIRAGPPGSGGTGSATTDSRPGPGAGVHSSTPASTRRAITRLTVRSEHPARSASRDLDTVEDVRPHPAVSTVTAPSTRSADGDQRSSRAFSQSRRNARPTVTGCSLGDPGRRGPSTPGSAPEAMLMVVMRR